MRLWHKDLIAVLPRQQLLGQWRECCAIARNISINGTPNHLLVNKIMDYPLSHFFSYSLKVQQEMQNRGYECYWKKFEKYISKSEILPADGDFDDIFSDWHNDRYFLQCYYNLQEKFDCGGISFDDWMKIDLFSANIFTKMALKKNARL